jgi:CcmD family protein
MKHHIAAPRPSGILAVAVAMAVCAFVFVGPARGQQAQPPPPGQEGFVPVKALPAAQETLPAAPLVIAAYAFVWVVLIVYLWALWRRLGKVQREIGDLNRRLDRSTRR